LQEVITQRQQATARLQSVRQALLLKDIQLAWDGWRELVLLRQMAHMAVQQWKYKTKAR